MAANPKHGQPLLIVSKFFFRLVTSQPWWCLFKVYFNKMSTLSSEQSPIGTISIKTKIMQHSKVHVHVINIQQSQLHLSQNVYVPKAKFDKCLGNTSLNWKGKGKGIKDLAKKERMRKRPMSCWDM